MFSKSLKDRHIDWNRNLEYRLCDTSAKARVGGCIDLTTYCSFIDSHSFKNSFAWWDRFERWDRLEWGV